MSQGFSTQPRLSLTAEQEEIILQVLERNHAYYMAQGMARAHMWPAEIISEIKSELTHAKLLPTTDKEEGATSSEGFAYRRAAGIMDMSARIERIARCHRSSPTSR
ncbi:hypothetical protein [uncultured Luteimonas sp.]|uniref:hypothetical protein n=1 Tax=uncultured Luteimonas sp. TaxID=453144 RepID=UPI002627283C|nr:hypothetical protein [uncultured Luteimonas sp.]